MAVGEDTSVEFSTEEIGEDEVRYFADAGGSGARSFGPVQGRDVDGETWPTLSTSSQSVYVLVSGGRTLGAAGGAAGALAHQRDRFGFGERLREPLGE